MVLVRGEAGVGKTALLRGFCDARAAPVRVLWGACDPLFTPRPLGPLLDIAAAVGGELAASCDRAAPGRTRSLRRCCRELRPPPTSLVLEDVHWADEATLDLVRLARPRASRRCRR